MQLGTDWWAKDEQAGYGQSTYGHEYGKADATHMSTYAPAIAGGASSNYGDYTHQDYQTANYATTDYQNPAYQSGAYQQYGEASRANGRFERDGVYVNLNAAANMYLRME